MPDFVVYALECVRPILMEPYVASQNSTILSPRVETSFRIEH